MDIIIFESDVLVGEDLRDAARGNGARVKHVRNVSNAVAALGRARGRAIILLSGRSAADYHDALRPALAQPGVQMILFASDQTVPGSPAPAAVLPDPFTDADVKAALRRVEAG